MNRFVSSIAFITCFSLFGTACSFVIASESRDATIHACIAASADRWWAIGDRGQALLSENAGRTWTQSTIDGAPNLYAGIAIDERNGVIVGGTIQPFSHRSAGVIQTTQDGGRRWREIPSEGLPRLTGIQKISDQHWIVWGDWSPKFQTGLLETVDGGTTWIGKALPASHIQTAAWKDARDGIVVDRLGRVFRFEASKPPMLLPVGGNASNRILKATHDDSGWWLIGQSGQIYHSIDGQQWLQKRLPGTAADQALICLSDIAFQKLDSPATASAPARYNESKSNDPMAIATSIDVPFVHQNRPDASGYGSELNVTQSPPRKRCWLVGSPGSVVWTSDDLGDSWQTQTTSQSLPLNSIATAGNDTLFAGGGLATIIGTRNSGQGWWILGQEGSRLALLSLTAIQASIPWDALSMVARESRGHAGGIIFHSERIYERASPWCESTTRAAVLASELSVSGLETLNYFPITSQPTGRLREELAIYDPKLQQPGVDSLIDRIAIHTIRQYRPDVIVCDSFNSEDPLLQATARMVVTARNRACDSRFECFSKESGIPDKAWDCKTLLARSISNPQNIHRHSELQLTSTTPLHREGILLGELLVSVGGQVSQPEESIANLDLHSASEESMPPWKQYGEYGVIFGARPSGGKGNLLPDEIRQPGAMRPAASSESLRYQTAITSFQRESSLQKVIEMEVESTIRDNRWLTALNQLINSTSHAARSPTLWTVAQEARRRGQWDRWSTCLELLIGDYPKEGAAELAAIQQAAWRGSSELRLWQAKLSPAIDSQPSPSSVVTASYHASTSSSPFESQTHDTSVRKVAANQTPDVRSPSRSTLQLQTATRSVNPVTPTRTGADHENIHSQSVSDPINGNQATRFASMTSSARANIGEDPRRVLLALSSRTDLTTPWNGIYGWSQLADQEYLLRSAGRAAGGAAERLATSPSTASHLPTPRPASPAAMAIPISKSRPVLDGALGDAVWKEAYQIGLQSIEASMQRERAAVANITVVNLIRDNRFLYVSGACGAQQRLTEKATTSGDLLRNKPGDRTHDKPTIGSDRFTLRVDTDRDFLTWFQFTVDSHGNLTDALNDMGSWDPRWYVATDRTEIGWTFEMAIPLNEILDEDFVKTADSQASDVTGGILWNFAMCRTQPGNAVQYAKPLMTEGLSPVSWFPGIIR